MSAVQNLWGLKDPDWKCCTCIFKKSKVGDVQDSFQKNSSRSSPSVVVAFSPEIRDKSSRLSKLIQKSPVSPRDSVIPAHDVMSLKSYYSESSGYFTPPLYSDEAFIKLDNEDIPEDVNELSNGYNYQERINDDETNFSDDGKVSSFHPVNFSKSNIIGQVNNNGDSIDYDETDFPDDRKAPSFQQLSSVHSSLSDISKEEFVESPTRETWESNHNFTVLEKSHNLYQPRFSSGSSIRRELENINIRSGVEIKNLKSKSINDLQTIVPRIKTKRSNIFSAPPISINNNFGGNMSPKSNVDASTVELSQQVMLPGAIASNNDIPFSTSTSINDIPKINTKPNNLPSIGSKNSVSRLNRAHSISKDKEILDNVLLQTNSSEWETCIQGLQELSKIANQHPELVENQINIVCATLAKHVKNLRSQVSRAACLTSTEVFATCKKGSDAEIKEITCALLQRTADTNKFLRADANSTLDTMCEHLPIHKIVPVVTTRGCCHQNALIRATSIRLLTEIVKKLGSEKILQLPKNIRDKILLAGTKALIDGNLETRKQGKVMMSLLIGGTGFSKALNEAVPQNVLRHSSKPLSLLKPTT